MILPPLTMWLRVEQPEHRPVRLWLPLFLVWLLLLPLWLLALVGTMLADAVLYLVGAEYHRYTLFLLRCSQLIAETRGLVVRVDHADSIVRVTIA